jgi:hypothetical protein
MIVMSIRPVLSPPAGLECTSAKTRRHHGLVGGLDCTKSLLWSGQQLGSPCACNYVRSELSGFQLKRTLQ